MKRCSLKVATFHRLESSLLSVAAATTLLLATSVHAQTTSGNVATGRTLYLSFCDQCHGATPGANGLLPIYNAANAGGVINRATTNGMGGFTGGSFNATQENDLAAYIASVTPNPNPVNLFIQHDSPGHTFTLPNIYLNTAYGDFASILVITPPVKGSISFVGKVATYTPAPGAFGADSFTWRAIGAPGDTAFTSNLRTVTLEIAPLPPVITSADTINAKVGVPATYFIQTSGGAPSSYNAAPLPQGMVLGGNVIAGTPAVATPAPFSTTLVVSNSGGSDMQTLVWNIAMGDQVITFPSQPTYTWPLISFGIVPASSNAGLPIAYSSLTPSVCAVMGAGVTPLTAGLCTVAANQAGNVNWLPANEVSRDIVINQGGQIINFGVQSPATRPYVLDGTFPLNPTANVLSGMPIFYSSLTPGVCSISGTTVSILGAGSCTIAASQPGDINWQAASTVTRSVSITAQLPKAPTGVSAGGANNSAAIAFVAPVDTGGVVILDYTVTCSATGQTTRTATAAASPIQVASLANGANYSCTVRARNSVGLSVASAAAAVTPIALAFTGNVVSRKTHAGVDYDVILDSAVPIAGSVAIEPRMEGVGHRLLFGFSGPIAVPGSAMVVDAQDNPLGVASTEAQGNDVRVTLFNIADGARLSVQLTGVNGVVGASVAMGILVGDVSGNGLVTAADISAVKARTGQSAAIGGNFRSDINLDGLVDSRDLAGVRARAGRSLGQ